LNTKRNKKYDILNINTYIDYYDYFKHGEKIIDPRAGSRSPL
jgi:hypothetical protein